MLSVYRDKLKDAASNFEYSKDIKVPDVPNSVTFIQNSKLKSDEFLS